MSDKPPIGLMPRNIYEDKCRIERIKAIVDTLDRYALAAHPIFPKWIQELRDLLGIEPEMTPDTRTMLPNLADQPNSKSK